MPDDIKDLTYQAKTETTKNGQRSTYALFSSAALTALDSNCGTSFGPLGSLAGGEGQCYGLLVINHAYNEGKLTFKEWLALSREWAEAVIRQYEQADGKTASWYNMDTNSASN